jgi:hypothetical protein
MKRIFAVVLAVAAIGSASAETSVGVSIGIHQPGVYGRIDIGDVPRPALVYAQPVIIAAPPVMYERRPIYLYVPPVHQQDWRRYCGRYAACGQPVYFVRDQWVRERYQQEHPGWDRGRKRGWDRHDGDRRGDRRNDDRGNGNGRGNGHGRDH